MLRWRWGPACAVVAGLAGGHLAAEEPSPEPRPAEAEAAPTAEAAVDQAAMVTASLTAEEAVGQAAAENLLDADALDELVAPIALYPDALLAQIFVAATYPIDIVMADRFINENKDLPGKELADKAAGEEWDPSIATLVGGFPSVVGQMAKELDWTEQLGDAVLAQTDDVLDAVQRMRSRAVAAGSLTSNEAQVVDTEEENISIEPADPNVVYVPSYDATTAYTAPPVGTAVAPGPYYPVDYGWSTGEIITTGAVVFGGALLLDEIFDDDDDYWHGPDQIDWDNDEFYPRRGDVEINGDVNIDRSRDNLVVGGDREGARIGDNDRSDIDRSGAWRADPTRQADARERVAARSGNQANAAEARQRLEQGGHGAGIAAGAAAGAAGAVAGRSMSAGTSGSDARAKLQASNQKRAAQGKPAVGSSAFETGLGGKGAAGIAAERGRQSTTKANRPQASTAKASRPKAAKPKAVSRPSSAGKSMKAPPRKSAAKSSAFKKPSSGSRAKASSSRGHASRGGGGGGGGRRR
jgi:hypothetical protein